MTKFKVGDKVRIKDEVLTNYQGESLLQDWRGKERVVDEIGGARDYWLAEEGASSLAWRALLDGKHLELIETFKEGDWVFVKDEPLTKVADYGDFPERGEWYEVHHVYRDGDVHLGEWGTLRLVHKRHLTHNPFKVGDRVVVADDNTCGFEDEQIPAVTAEMQSSPFVTHQPDGIGDIRVNGYYVHKRHVTPVKPKIDLPVTDDEINSLVDRLAGVTAEAVDHPEHYNQGAFETIDVIEDWGLNFNVGNAVKYISRYEHKNNPKEDLRKAIWYLNRELESLGGGDAINP